MTFLQLVQSLIVQAGVSGTLSTVAGVSGEMGRVTGWINDAWNELQTARPDWKFMRSSGLLGGGATFVTVAGQAAYPLGTGPGTVGVAAANFGSWAEETFRNYSTATGFVNEIPMDLLRGPEGFDNWREVYMLGANRNVQTRPVVVAIGPNMEVCVGPPPNALYTITGDYYVAPTLMAADTDTPFGLPARYHMLIVYDALLKYGYYEAAADVLSRARAERGRLNDELEALYAPGFGIAGALA